MKIRTLILIWLFVFMINQLFSQNNFIVLRGSVVDKKNNISIPKAEVTFPMINKKLLTDKEGRFNIALPHGVQKIEIFYDGYYIFSETLKLKGDSTMVFMVIPLTISKQIEEITITAKTNKIEQKFTSVETIDILQLNLIPAIGGQKDLLKAMTFFPGVRNSSEGTADIEVRGGNANQNLYLLDNNTIYNSTHIYGLISTYNPLFISNATLYKAAFPAKFGGRLSSIVDVSTHKLSLSKFKFETEIGFITANVSLSLPIVKNKSALMITGRRTFFDVFQKLAMVLTSENEINSFNFYDISLKYVHNFKNNNILNVVCYSDKDNNFLRYNFLPNSSMEDNFINQNSFFGINYQKIVTNKISNNLYFNYTNYKTKISSTKIDSTVISFYEQFKTIINDYSIKDIFSYNGEKNQLNVGIDYTCHGFIPSNNFSYNLKDTILRDNISKLTSHEFSFFTDYEFNITKKISTFSGLRISDYFVNKKNYFNLEPRFSLHYKINKQNAIKLSYSYMTQPIQMISNSGLGMPVNIWLSSDDLLKPASSNQFVLAFNNKFVLKQVHNFTFSAEIYYKTFNNILNYIDGYSSSFLTSNYLINSVEDWHDIISAGQGKSYGCELSLLKTSGKFTFQTAYTLSWSFNHFDKINNGKIFWANNDRRHYLSTFFNYSLNKKIEIGLVFIYMTGQPITLPKSAYNYFYNPFFEINNANVNTWAILFEQTERNTYRMMPFHRMDLNIRWDISGKNKNFKSYIVFDIYNIYNRKNPYYYYLSSIIVDEGNNKLNNKIVLKSVSLFPIIPSISYSIKF